MASAAKSSQQVFLMEAKVALGLQWDELAESCGIKPRALKTYRMPDTSKDHRTLPDLARRAIQQLLDAQRKTG